MQGPLIIGNRIEAHVCRRVAAVDYVWRINVPKSPIAIDYVDVIEHTSKWTKNQLRTPIYLHRQCFAYSDETTTDIQYDVVSRIDTVFQGFQDFINDFSGELLCLIFHCLCTSSGYRRRKGAKPWRSIGINILNNWFWQISRRWSWVQRTMS